MSRPAVFVDRDGVINAGGNIHRVDDMRVLPGAAEAIGELKAAGYAVVVVTNQGGLGEDFQGRTLWRNAPLDRRGLDAIHGEMLRQLGPEAAPHLIKFCPHATFLNCNCRKPKPGMLRSAARELDLALPDSYMVGDRGTDLQAGAAAGTRLILVLTGEEPEAELEWRGKAVMVRSLREAADEILAGSQ